jgi:hypothetical protein
MIYKYTNFIPENVAPIGAKAIGVYKDDIKIGEIPLGHLSHFPMGEKLYSFGMVSDIHMTGDSQVGTKLKDGNGYITDGYYFRKALEFFHIAGCDFVCVSGDMTDVGLFGYEKETTKGNYYYYFPD